jgi:choline transport protein
MADTETEKRLEASEIATNVRPSLEKVDQTVEGTLDGEIVNASGHHDELKRHFSIWSLCGLALTIDNAWVALGGSLYVAACTR